MAETVHPTIYKLEPDYAQRVGEFITKWAYLEWRLHETMYSLMQTGPKIGRIALREPRVVDYLTMIEDTAQLKNITVSVDWGKLKTIMQQMESWRDRFAHGIWLEVRGSPEPAIQVLTGKTVIQQGGPATKSRIDPKAFQVSLEQLDKAIDGVDRGVSLVQEIKNEIDAQVQQAP